MRAEKRIIGLLAHVDAGKTTLSEALLYQSGQLRRLGRVDHGDAFLDTDVQERERGITIFSKQAELSWQDAAITLLDTPGHVDFSSEMERTLPVLDAAVLLISGADGVQGHTLTLWRLLKAYHVPVFLFINKMDQPTTSRELLMQELKNRLDEGCIDFAAPDYLDEVAMCSENALQSYLEQGAIPADEIAALVQKRAVFPCFFGSALKQWGITALLDALITYLPLPEYPEAFSARAFKIARDSQGARLVYLKITGGQLRVKETIGTEKVNQLRLYSGAKFRPLDVAAAGTVCAATGLDSVQAGDALGAQHGAKTPLLTPVFTYQVLLPAGCEAHQALQMLRQLEEEDPQLHVIWNGALREMHVQLMGEVQLEILRRVLLDRFQLAVDFGQGSILYRETIADTVEGVGHYEPLRHYAEVQLRLEPLPSGSGMQFAADCSEDVLERSWQRLILTHLMEKQHLGVLTGAPITDIKITLTAGRAHLKHTEGGDFRQATYRAVRQGLMQAQSVLLEPWYDLRLEIPAECVGRAMNDLQQMGGSFSPPEPCSGGVILTGSAPVAEARHYAREVAAYTHGRGQLLCVLRGYLPCRNQAEIVSQAHYDPLRDPENSPDSVFCAHGAGYMVKWSDAPQAMHLPSSLHAVPKAPSSVSAARLTVSDAELDAIFERTYGPRKPYAAPNAPASRPTVNNRPLEILPPQPEYLLVDGYNIIFAWPELKALSQISLEQARQSLMDILCNYRGMRPCEVILVFDAYKVAGNPGAKEDYHNIHIVYTREAETADNYIEKTIHDMARQYRVRVATSDALEQMIILGGGALRVSAKEFYAEVEDAKVEIAKILARNNGARSPVSNMEKALRSALQRTK